MNIPRVQNYRPSFKFALPGYRVEPFAEHPSNVRVELNTETGIPPTLVLHKYSQPETVTMNNGVTAMYYYPLPARETTKYTLVLPENSTTYTCDGDSMMNTALKEIQRKHNLPDILSEKDGKVIGKIVNNIPLNLPDSLKFITEPTIIVAHEEIVYGIENPNVVAIITAPETGGGLGHIPSLLRNQTDLFGVAVDPKVLRELDKLNGKNVEMELKDGKLTFKETQKKGKPREVAPVKIPQLKYSNKVLNSEECTPDVIGGKAANLRKLEIMAEEGKIDAIIPKFVALPWGWLEKFNIDECTKAIMRGDYETEHKIMRECWQYYIDGGKMEELVNILKEKEIGRNGLMIRSCFNDEDLPNFSNAGVYDSVPINSCDNAVNSIFSCIYSWILPSKYKKSGRSIRKYYNIPDEDVKPGIVLQDKVDSKNCFTIYTDNGDGNLIIDYRTYKSNDDEKYNRVICPHLYTYNKKTGKLTYQTKQVRLNAGANFDEKCRLKYSDPVEIDLTGDTELNKRLKKAIDNALAVEKEFGKPQDIEGGFDKDGRLYFWQTRNVVGLD